MRGVDEEWVQTLVLMTRPGRVHRSEDVAEGMRGVAVYVPVRREGRILRDSERWKRDGGS